MFLIDNGAARVLINAKNSVDESRETVCRSWEDSTSLESRPAQNEHTTVNTPTAVPSPGAIGMLVFSIIRRSVADL